MGFAKYIRTSRMLGIVAMVANSAIYAQSLTVFEVLSFNSNTIDETPLENVVGRVKYNSNIKNSITEQSTLVLKLDFIYGTTVLDVVSVHTDDSSHAYSAVSPDGLDILTVAESNGTMLGSLIYKGKLYKFKPAGNGDTLIIEADENQFVEQAQNSEVLVSNSKESFKRARVSRIGGPDNGSKIDVIITYTPEFVAEQGANNIAAYIAQLEQEAKPVFPVKWCEHDSGYRSLLPDHL